MQHRSLLVIGIGLIVVLVAGGLFLAFTELPSGQAISHSTSPDSLCLVPIPLDANITGSSKESGIIVTFANGTSLFFPSDGCPQPAKTLSGSNVSPSLDLYSAAVAAEKNQTFVVLENGTNYILNPTAISGGSNAIGDRSVTLEFDHYSNETYHQCNNPNAILLNRIASAIQATFYARNAQGTESWDLTDPIFTVIPPGLLNESSCPGG